jgi:hypothetical protein
VLGYQFAPVVRRAQSRRFVHCPCRSNAKRVCRHLLCCECRQRDEATQACDGWHDEPIEVVEHGPSKDLAESAAVALIGASKRTQVLRALAGRVVDEETLQRALSWSDPLTADERLGPIGRHGCRGSI